MKNPTLDKLPGESLDKYLEEEDADEFFSEIDDEDEDDSSDFDYR